MQKPECKLIGENGNIFNLLSIAKRVLTENDMKNEAEEMVQKVLNSKSYYEALNIISNYVSIV